jgi:hypothetical protein
MAIEARRRPDRALKAIDGNIHLSVLRQSGRKLSQEDRSRHEGIAGARGHCSGEGTRENEMPSFETLIMKCQLISEPCDSVAGWFRTAAAIPDSSIVPLR